MGLCAHSARGLQGPATEVSLGPEAFLGGVACASLSALSLAQRCVAQRSLSLSHVTLSKVLEGNSGLNASRWAAPRGVISASQAARELGLASSVGANQMP